jgi:hypothetical protein
MQRNATQSQHNHKTRQDKITKDRTRQFNTTQHNKRQENTTQQKIRQKKNNQKGKVPHDNPRQNTREDETL